MLLRWSQYNVGHLKMSEGLKCVSIAFIVDFIGWTLFGGFAIEMQPHCINRNSQ